MAKDIEVKLDPEKLLRVVRNQLTAGAEQASLWVEGTVKRSFGSNGPSKPGEPPAVDTGRLRSSITHQVITEENAVVGTVGSNVEYAKDLELGTNRVAARPYLRPAVFNNKEKILRQFVGGAKKAGGGK